MEAFNKMDSTGDGVLSLDDIRSTYCVDGHPKFKSGELTKDEILTQYLNNFEKNGTRDGKVRSHGSRKLRTETRGNHFATHLI